MKHYYISANNDKGFEEVTEAEFIAFIGDETTRPYIGKVYRGVMSMDEVPEELREAVAAAVANRVARWGEYQAQEIPATELKDMIEEIV